MSTRFPIIASRPTVALTSFLALACAAPAERAVAVGAGVPPPAEAQQVQLASREPAGGLPARAAIPAGLTEALAGYLDAHRRADWSAVWGYTATTERESLITLGRHPAERSRETARAQGFASTDDVKAATDEGWFAANRAALAKAGRLPALPASAAPESLTVTPVVLPGALPGRAHVAVTFDDGNGAQIVIGAVMQGSDWRFLSPKVTQR